MRETNTKGRSLAFLTSTLKLLVLAMVAGAPKHGYTVLKEMNALVGDLIGLREGSLYPILHRLEKNGCLKSEVSVIAPGRHRRYYEITPKGREALRSKKAQWADIVRAINAITAGVSARVPGA